jgi:hypothetical protein
MNGTSAKYAGIALSVAVIVFLTPCQVLKAALPDIISITETTAYRWNFDTTTNVYSQSTGTSTFGDMTRTDDGRFLAYRTTYGGRTPALYQIDPTTGTSNLVVASSAGAPHVVALAIMPDGDLFGYDVDLRFVRINPTTLAYQVVPVTASNGAIYMATGGMATSPGGEIYCWASGYVPGAKGIFSELFKIDPIAGTAQEIGGYKELGCSQSFEAMAFSPGGRLFGFTEINGGINGGPFSPNGIYELNLTTGMPTLLEQRSVLAGIRGAAFIPEPSSMVLLAIATVGLFASVWRRPRQSA